MKNEIQSRILTIRGVQVMLDRDLAAAYQVTTSAFNQAVKRNLNRFPDGFRFQLTKEEHSSLIPGVAVTVVVSARGRRNLHDMDVSQFNRQYANALVVKETEKFHDRYLIIDNTTLIHVGASLNTLGRSASPFRRWVPRTSPTSWLGCHKAALFSPHFMKSVTKGGGLSAKSGVECRSSGGTDRAAF